MCIAWLYWKIKFALQTQNSPLDATGVKGNFFVARDQGQFFLQRFSCAKIGWTLHYLVSQPWTSLKVKYRWMYVKLIGYVKKFIISSCDYNCEELLISIGYPNSRIPSGSITLGAARNNIMFTNPTSHSTYSWLSSLTATDKRYGGHEIESFANMVWIMKLTLWYECAKQHVQYLQILAATICIQYSSGNEHCEYHNDSVPRRCRPWNRSLGGDESWDKPQLAMKAWGPQRNCCIHKERRMRGGYYIRRFNASSRHPLSLRLCWS